MHRRIRRASFRRRVFHTHLSVDGALHRQNLAIKMTTTAVYTVIARVADDINWCPSFAMQGKESLGTGAT